MFVINKNPAMAYTVLKSNYFFVQNLFLPSDPASLSYLVSTCVLFIALGKDLHILMPNVFDFHKIKLVLPAKMYIHATI